MTIREMTKGDIPEVIYLGRLMHEESQYRELPYDPAKVAVLCHEVLNDNDSVCFVADHGELVGMLAAYVVDYSYGGGMIASDRLVFVAPEKRGGTAFARLVKSYVEWAEARADIIMLGQTTGVNQDAVAKLYRKMGFHQIGGIFRR